MPPLKLPLLQSRLTRALSKGFGAGYAPLGAIAAYKALYELVFKPFFWDKTAHGLSLLATGRRRSDGALDLAGIKLQPGHERL